MLYSPYCIVPQWEMLRGPQDHCCVYEPLHRTALCTAGSEGPKTKDPSKYIRYIFNRIILENATVRGSNSGQSVGGGDDPECLSQSSRTRRCAAAAGTLRLRLGVVLTPDAKILRCIMLVNTRGARCIAT